MVGHPLASESYTDANASEFGMRLLGGSITILFVTVVAALWFNHSTQQTGSITVKLPPAHFVAKPGFSRVLTS